MSDHWTAILPKATCREAVAWAKTQPDLATAWRECQRGDWMLWLAGAWAGPPGRPSRKKLVLAACACARLGLHAVPTSESRPLRAIETAEAYCRGEATLDEVRAAAAYAAYAAADAADADAYAAAAAAAAYAAARAAVLAQCADIVRRHYYPEPPTQEVAHE